MAGRPTMFKKLFTTQAHEACARLGAADKDLAALFGVDESTINNWKARHAEFLESIKKGKREFDDGTVRNALLKRACGYDHEGRHYPPDTTACIFWLKNRRPERWRDRVDHKLAGNVDHAITVHIFDGGAAEDSN